MKTIFALILILSATGCASWMKDEDVVRRQKTEVERMAQRRENGQNQDALREARAFLAANPGSSFTESARYEEARALEGLGRFAEAGEIYRGLRDRAAATRGGMAALAEWRLSFVAESAGDDVKSLAHLLSAEKRRTDLPVSVATVEIPARKAMTYQRLGRENEARQCLREAEKGLAALMSAPGPQPSAKWLARLYLEMGRSSTAAVDAGNFTASLRAQRISQTYLLKALRAENGGVPAQAFEILRSNYANLWNTVVTAKGEGADGAVAARQAREKQVPMLTELLRVLEEALQARPVGDPNNVWEEKFFAMADVMSAKTREVLYSNSATTGLTNESNSLNGLRR